jgi:hypothetical protein
MFLDGCKGDCCSWFEDSACGRDPDISLVQHLLAKQSFWEMLRGNLG